MSSTLSRLVGEERGFAVTLAAALVIAVLLAAVAWYMLHSLFPENIYQKVKGILAFYSLLVGMVVVGWRRFPGFLLIFFGIAFAALASAFS